MFFRQFTLKICFDIICNGLLPLLHRSFNQFFSLFVLSLSFSSNAYVPVLRALCRLVVPSQFFFRLYGFLTDFFSLLWWLIKLYTIYGRFCSCAATSHIYRIYFQFHDLLCWESVLQKIVIIMFSCFFAKFSALTPTRKWLFIKRNI